MFKVGRGSKVVWGVADYWVSRVTWDPVNDEYHIKGKQSDCIVMHFTF